jgi:hypothetical protein
VEDLNKNNSKKITKEKIIFLVNPCSTVSFLRGDEFSEQGRHVPAANRKVKMEISKPKNYSISIGGVQRRGEMLHVKKQDCEGILGVDGSKKNKVSTKYGGDKGKDMPTHK